MDISDKALEISPSERQSALLVQKVRRMAVKNLGLMLKKDGINKVSAVFANGSTIVGLPENEEKIRGFSDVRLLLVDEASTVDEAVYEAVTPMLAVSNGTMWLLSTPRGPRGFFYREWIGREAWVRLAGAAAGRPRFSGGILGGGGGGKERRGVLRGKICE